VAQIFHAVQKGMSSWYQRRKPGPKKEARKILQRKKKTNKKTPNACKI